MSYYWNCSAPGSKPPAIAAVLGRWREQPLRVQRAFRSSRLAVPGSERQAGSERHAVAAMSLPASSRALPAWFLEQEVQARRASSRELRHPASARQLGLRVQRACRLPQRERQAQQVSLRLEEPQGRLALPLRELLWPVPQEPEFPWESSGHSEGLACRAF